MLKAAWLVSNKDLSDFTPVLFTSKQEYDLDKEELVQEALWSGGHTDKAAQERRWFCCRS